MSTPSTAPSSPRRLAAFFGLTFLLSWGVLLPEAAALRGLIAFRLPTPFLILAGFGPALSALLLTARMEGISGVRSLLRRLTWVRVGLVWYAVVLLGPPLLFLTAIGLGLLLGITVALSHPPVLDLVGAQDISPALLLPPLFLYLMISLLGEEIGWRGFALPHLLQIRSELAASVVLGLLWGLWHLPLAWVPSLQAGMAHLPFGWFLVDIVAMSILYTWVFVNTRGSLWMALLLHTANNAAAMYLPILPPAAPDTRLFSIVMALKWVLVLGLLAARGPVGWAAARRSTPS